MRDHSSSDAAKAVRRTRQQQRKAQADDPLAERARLVAFWRKCAETNRGYIPHNGAWWFSLLTQPGFRHLLMPRLRAIRNERESAWKARHAAELHGSAQQFAQRKAEAAAAKARANQPQMELLT